MTFTGDLILALTWLQWNNYCILILKLRKLRLKRKTHSWWVVEVGSEPRSD